MLALRRGQQWLFHPWGLTPSPGREKTGRGGGVPQRTVKQGGEGASPEHGEDTWKSSRRHRAPDRDQGLQGSAPR